MSSATPKPTFRPLNGRLGWPTNIKDAISVSLSGLRLEAAVDGPLSLGWVDGSLGGLTLPRGFATDRRGHIYLLDPPRGLPAHRSRAGQRVRKYTSSAQAFVPLPTIGGWGDEARRFRDASNIAIADELLFVADEGNGRIQVCALDTLQLLHVWDLSGGDIRKSEPAATTALDVTSFRDTTYILDGRHARVLRHRAGEDSPKPFVQITPGSRQWTRIAVDRHGQIYLFDASRSALDVYAQDGRWLRRITDAGDIRDRFETPVVAIVFDARTPPSPWSGYVRLVSGDAAKTDEETLFDRRGGRVRIPKSELAPRKLYREVGIWISQPIDSGLHACQWHRLVVDVGDLPPGTHVVVSTFSSDVNKGHPHHDSPLWQPSLRVYGQMQRRGKKPSSVQVAPLDALVQSREGQYLWILVRLQGDGFDTPLVRGIDAYFPRQSYLRFLPAIYSSDDESRWFLERFLSIVQTEWDDIDRRVRQVARHFDIDAAPAEWLDLLAGWMAVPLEQGWTSDEKRNLLRVARGLISRRGTRDGLRAFLQGYLHNITGIAPEAQGQWPVVVEGFRQRQRLLLSAQRDGVLGTRSVLWSDSVVARPQLDVFAQEGEIRLVSTGDPARDLFHQYSHRFTVAVPAAWIRSADDERMLRRAIDAEKPAHTVYALHLIAPRFRVGVQSTVGIDTIVGDSPALHLDGGCGSPAPGRPPRNRLGYDTVLAGSAPASPRVQMPHSRIGLDTVLN